MRFFRTVLILTLIFIPLSQPGCIWRLWTKEKPIEEKTFDVYGTVQSVTPDRLVIQTKKGEQRTFVIAPSSIKGSEFKEGAYVHVYYKTLGEGEVITMVVEKIK